MKFFASIGDRWDDGHGKYEQVLMTTDATSIDIINDAYKRSVELTGIQLDELCERYEDTKVPKEVVEVLSKHGFDASEVGVEAYKGEHYCNYETFANLWAWFVNLSLDTSLKVSKVEESETIPEIEIGGYGLFH